MNDLDERVAVILGWKLDERRAEWVWGGKTRPGRESNHPYPGTNGGVPHYSTDWGLVEEMLAWLRKQVTVRIHLFQDGTRKYNSPVELDVWREEPPLNVRDFQGGDSLPEVLAQMVRDVALLMGEADV